jgi:hypothetical protein
MWLAWALRAVRKSGDLRSIHEYHYIDHDRKNSCCTQYIRSPSLYALAYVYDPLQVICMHVLHHIVPGIRQSSLWHVDVLLSITVASGCARLSALLHIQLLNRSNEDLVYLMTV